MDRLFAEMDGIEDLLGSKILTLRQTAEFLDLTETEVKQLVEEKQLTPLSPNILKFKAVDLAKFICGIDDDSFKIALASGGDSALQYLHQNSLTEDCNMSILNHGEGSVYFDTESNRWKCAFYYIDPATQEKKRKILSAKTQDAVIEKVNQFKGTLPANRGNLTVPPSQQEQLTYKQVWQEYMQMWLAKPRSDITRKNRETTFQNYILPHFGEMVIGDIKPIDIQAFLSKFEHYADGRQRSNSTIKKTYTDLKSVFRYAHDNGYISKLPLSGVDLPEGKHTDREEQFLEYEQLVEVFQDLKGHPKYFLIAKMLLATGVRPEELLALRWSQIDFRKKTVKITNAMALTKTTDGSKAQYKQSLTKTKTRESVRTIQLGTEGISAFAEWKQYLIDSGCYAKGQEQGNEDFIMLDANGNIQVYHSLHNNYMNYIKNWGKHKHHANFYKFRHCFASYTRSVGVDPIITSRWMGHSGDTLTLRVYTSIPNEDIQRNADKYDGFLKKLFEEVENANNSLSVA